MTDEQIRRIILERISTVNGTTNRGVIDHTDGVVRGLLWALTGVDHGTYLTSDIARLFDIAGINYRKTADGVWVDDISQDSQS